jgi:hypothetical protein
MYTFDKANGNVPSHHRTQYFEMLGDRAIYDDGWIASTKVIRNPWDNVTPTKSVLDYPWELYDITKDWTQTDDLAAKNPKKLKELQDLFWKEAEKYQVLPLDNSFVARAITPRPSITAGRTVFTWTRALTGTPNGDAPSILNASYTFNAEIEVPDSNTEGMLITQGGRFGGYGFYLLTGKPVFLWNLVDLKRIRWEGPDALAAGKHTVEFDFKYEGMGPGTMAFNNYSGIGQGGTGVLKVDGKEVSTQKMDHSIPFILQFDESLDVGSDTLTGVNDADYQPPFTFTGKIDKITLTIDRPKLSPEDIKKLQSMDSDKKTSE